MNRDRMLLGLGAALVVAFLASIYVYRQLQRVQSAVAKVVKQVQVVVAAGPLKLGQRLTATDLTLLDWPEGKQPKGSFSRTEDCVGRAVIVPLVQGEVVLDQELAKREAGAGLPVTIPEGMRAVSVGVDDVVAVAGFVTPGTIVDVLVTGQWRRGQGRIYPHHSGTRSGIGRRAAVANGERKTADRPPWSRCWSIPRTEKS